MMRIVSRDTAPLVGTETGITDACRHPAKRFPGHGRQRGRHCAGAESRSIAGGKSRAPGKSRHPLFGGLLLAGLVPWPKLFHNLRASRQTEPEERFPSHVVCAWLGNGRPVAEEHYLQVTEEHSQRAVSPAAQTAAVDGGKELKGEETADADYSSSSFPCKGLRRKSFFRSYLSLGDEGLEPPTLSV